jgi:hypothetical protein
MPNCQTLALQSVAGNQTSPDIQDMINFSGHGNRTGMGDLAAVIINPSYNDMKTAFPRNTHNRWEWLMVDVNMWYAAIDGYVIFELYMRIKNQ